MQGTARAVWGSALPCPWPGPVLAAMAIERRDLGDLLLGLTDGLDSACAARILHVFELTPVAAALVAIEPLRSTLVDTMVAAMHGHAIGGTT